jgi:hypothetical protein
MSETNQGWVSVFCRSAKSEAESLSVQCKTSHQAMGKKAFNTGIVHGGLPAAVVHRCTPPPIYGGGCVESSS